MVEVERDVRSARHSSAIGRGRWSLSPPAPGCPLSGGDFAGDGLADSFVGTLLIAGATSLPELVVTVRAMRIGAVDMAIGNLLGSNLFDVLILAIDDIFFRKGPLLGRYRQPTRFPPSPP